MHSHSSLVASPLLSSSLLCTSSAPHHRIHTTAASSLKVDAILPPLAAKEVSVNGSDKDTAVEANWKPVSSPLPASPSEETVLLDKTFLPLEIASSADSSTQSNETVGPPIASNVPQKDSTATTIRSVCRIRPMDTATNSNKELDDKCLKIVNAVTIEICTPLVESTFSTKRPHVRQFTTDTILSPSTTQAEVFDSVGIPSLEAIFNGMHATILAYGQTGSGKTHTLLGSLSELVSSPSFVSSATISLNKNGATANAAAASLPANLGLLPRMVFDCFKRAQEAADTTQFAIKLSILEIYNEVVNDLITGKKHLKIYRTKTFPSSSCRQKTPPDDTSPFYFTIKGLSEHPVENSGDVFTLLRTALTNRKVASTKLNSESSRSHLVFMLDIQQTHKLSGTSKLSRLCLVDLAGSERMQQGETVGVTLKEGSMINKSLTCLGKVIYALAECSKAKASARSIHVPYRDSKLTRVLKHSFGGNSQTTLILTCSPERSNASETLFTLRFGERAKSVKNRPFVHTEVKGTTEAEMQAQVFAWKTYAQRLIQWGLLGIASRYTVADTPTFAYNSKQQQQAHLDALQGENGYTENSMPAANVKDKTLFAAAANKIEIVLNRVDWERAWQSMPRILEPLCLTVEEEARETLHVSEETAGCVATIKIKADADIIEGFQSWACTPLFSDSTDGGEAADATKFREVTATTIDETGTMPSAEIGLGQRQQKAVLPYLQRRCNSFHKHSFTYNAPTALSLSAHKDSDLDDTWFSICTRLIKRMFIVWQWVCCCRRRSSASSTLKKLNCMQSNLSAKVQGIECSHHCC